MSFVVYPACIFAFFAITCHLYHSSSSVTVSLLRASGGVGKWPVFFHSKSTLVVNEFASLTLFWGRFTSLVKKEPKSNNKARVEVEFKVKSQH